MRIYVLAVVCLVAGANAACMVNTSVTVFHEEGFDPKGMSFCFIPSKEQLNSLEYKSYAGRISSYLQTNGMSEAEPNKADLLVYLTYEIDSGQQVVRSKPVYGQTGVSGSQTYGTAYRSYGGTTSYSGTTTYTPTYGVVGSRTSSETMYTRSVQIELLRRVDLDAERVVKVYEANAVSAGTSSQLNQVMRNILAAIFKKFPGENGKTYQVSAGLITDP